jgi:hypothetical protein
MRIWIAALLALALAACGQGQNASTAAPEMAAPAASPAPPPMEPSGGAVGRAADMDSAALGEIAVTGEERQASSGPAQTPGAQAPAPISYLAYAYSVGLQLPGPRLSETMERHATACRSAGPRLCQLINATRQGDPEAYISGSVTLRGEPAWLQRFMGGLASDAERAGGKITAQSTSTEDLTRAIVDTEAGLRAKKALRERLQRLLESRPGRLAELLEVERELARVQAEIDATESNLAVMRTRVDMSLLTLNYESSQRPVASDTFKPLVSALANFIGYIVQGIAVIITLIAVLIPWLIVGGLVVWALLWLRRRRGGRLLPRREPPAEPPSAANS